MTYKYTSDEWSFYQILLCRLVRATTTVYVYTVYIFTYLLIYLCLATFDMTRPGVAPSLGTPADGHPSEY